MALRQAQDERDMAEHHAVVVRPAQDGSQFRKDREGQNRRTMRPKEKRNRSWRSFITTYLLLIRSSECNTEI